MQSTAARILDTLQREGPLALQEVALAVDRSPSATLRRLQALTEAGRIVREGDRKEARYALAPRIAVDATFPQDGQWLRWDWTADGVDWMFPLAGRVQFRRRAQVLLRNAFSQGLLQDATVIVFGSAARHDARADSDLDILVLARAGKKGWKDLAFDMEIQGEGRIQVEVYREMGRVPPPLRRSIIAEGVTVFSSTSPPFFVETLRLAAGDG